MRAFLALIFLFSSSVGTFDQWLFDVQNNEQYKVIHSQETGSNKGEIDFRLYLKDHPTCYLLAHLTYEPNYVRCRFNSDVDRIKQRNEWLSDTKKEAKSMQEAKQEQWNSLWLLYKEVKRPYDKNGKITQGMKDVEVLLNEAQEQIKKAAKKLKNLANPLTEYGSLYVEFTFNPVKNEGRVGYVEASPYLVHGKWIDLPKKGFGATAMNEIMHLYDHWMNPDLNGKVSLLDKSWKFVGGAFWDQLRALSI